MNNIVNISSTYYLNDFRCTVSIEVSTVKQNVADKICNIVQNARSCNEVAMK